MEQRKLQNEDLGIRKEPKLGYASGPIKVHVDNMGTIEGLRKGEKECIKPRAGDADRWNNREELHELVKRGVPVEV